MMIDQARLEAFVRSLPNGSLIVYGPFVHHIGVVQQPIGSSMFSDAFLERLPSLIETELNEQFFPITCRFRD